MKTKILGFREENGEFILRLEESPFRKAGGGQPCDFGTITSDEFEAVVYDVLPENEVQVRVSKGKPEVMEVIVGIDEKRREILTRMHTAEHLFFKSLEKEVPTLKLDKIRLDEIESLLIVSGDDVDWEKVFKAEDNVNKIISEDRKVLEHNVKKEEVKKRFPDARIKLERIKDSAVRVIEVADFDFSACAGTHCGSTKDVGKFFVTKLNSAGPNKYEIRFKVEVMDDLFEFSRVARKVMSILGTELPKVESTLNNLKDNFEKYKKMARDVKVEPKAEEVGGTKFKHNVVEVEPKQLMKQVNDLIEDNTVVCFINKTEKVPQIQVAVSEDLSADAAFIVGKVAEKFNGKGGGKKNFAMGSIDTNKFDEVFEYVKELIK